MPPPLERLLPLLNPLLLLPVERDGLVELDTELRLLVVTLLLTVGVVVVEREVVLALRETVVDWLLLRDTEVVVLLLVLTALRVVRVVVELLFNVL